MRNLNLRLFIYFVVILAASTTLVSVIRDNRPLTVLILLLTIGAVYLVTSTISRKIRKQENHTRRQLTQNISHELKTPIASIMGYMESLIANPDLDTKRKAFFIDRSYKQAKRLSELVQDINTLNKLNDNSELYERKICDLTEIVENTISDDELLASEKQCRIQSYLPETLLVNGNSTLLSSIFRNLTDNALIHAGEDTDIEIRLVSQDMFHYTLSFSDSGKGIPEEHLAHIFDRFYRIDQGRSRKVGGTGLGLAIVKNAVAFHKGTIKVGNRPNNGGLRFEFTLRK